MALLVFFGVLAVLLVIGVPVGISLIGCAIALMTFLGMFNPSVIAQQMVTASNSAALMAIPFFMFAGEIMARGGLSKRIVDSANVFVGRIRGGLGYVAVLASIIFSGLSGSAIADAAALGAILIPLMEQNGYSKERSVGLICSASITAPIIPPSIPMIVLGTTVGLSISRLFMSGIIPGIFIGICLMIAWSIVVRKDGLTDQAHFEKGEARHILFTSIPALVLPIFIIVGIRFGVFTPTEAGAFAVVYAILICLFVYRELNFKELMDVCMEAAKSTSTVMLIVASASAVGWFITIAQIPKLLISYAGPLIGHPMLLLFIINIFLFLMGMVLDVSPNILIFAPVLFPLIEAAGIDPYVFALIMCFNLCLGLLTPPVGIVLYIGCSITNLPLGRIVKGVIPFLVIQVVILILFILFPGIFITAPLNLLM